MSQHLAGSIALLLCSVGFVPAEDPAPPPAGLTERLPALAAPLRIVEGKLSGPGAELLAAGASGTRFVALGEEHNTRAIPRFTTALFRMLHDQHGFEHLALEEGPCLGRLLSAAARAGEPGAVAALARRYPNAFHMYTAEEIEMVADVGRISTAAEPIWGLNQEFGALHVFERLTALAPTDTARRTAEELAERARLYESERFRKNVHYLVKIARGEDFSRLAAAFGASAGAEAEALIAQTALSQRIYAPYGADPAPGYEVFLASGRSREDNMKRLFAERCREAEAGTGRPPRVLVKAGHLHLYRGLSPRTELYTLGNFLAEVATFEGSSSLHIYTLVDRAYVRKGWSAPIALAALDAPGTVFDLRPLYSWAHGNENLEAEVRRLILAYDVVVFLRDGEDGSLDGLRTPRFHWYPEE